MDSPDRRVNDSAFSKGDWLRTFCAILLLFLAIAIVSFVATG